MASLESRNAKLKTKKTNQKLWYQGKKNKINTDKLPNHPTLKN